MPEKNKKNKEEEEVWSKVKKEIIHFLKNTAGIFLVLGFLGFIGGAVVEGIDSVFL